MIHDLYTTVVHICIYNALLLHKYYTGLLFFANILNASKLRCIFKTLMQFKYASTLK